MDQTRVTRVTPDNKLQLLTKFLSLDKNVQTKTIASALIGIGFSAIYGVSYSFEDAPELTEFELIEYQRTMSQKNGEINAKLFQQRHNQFHGTYISSDVDYSINSDCITGDGWSKVKLVDGVGKVAADLMCSTVSASLGCALRVDFNQQKHSIQENTCNLQIPVPLPELSIY